MTQEVLLDQGQLRLKRCRHGVLSYLSTDQYIGRSLDLYGEFSEGEVTLFQQLIRPGHLLVEVGANIGSHTVALAKLAGPRGRVVAFEPQRVLFQILCGNVALNVLSNVYAHPWAIGAEEGSIKVPNLDYSQEANYGGLPLGEWEQGEDVPLTTIDSLNLPALHFLKIDIEGMEYEAVVGAEQTIGRFRPAMYLENDRPEKSPQLIQKLFELNYRLYWHRPPLFSQDNYFGNTDNIFPGIRSINMFCLPREVNQDVPHLAEITSPQDDWRQV